jgi:hypothetical protein
MCDKRKHNIYIIIATKPFGIVPIRNPTLSDNRILRRECTCWMELSSRGRLAVVRVRGRHPLVRYRDTCRSSTDGKVSTWRKPGQPPQQT